MLRIERHIRWSLDKSGAVRIFNRLGECKTVFIRSTSGKEIWNTLVSDAQGDLTARLKLLFGYQVTLPEIERDTNEFLSQLMSQGIICEMPRDD